MKIIPNLKNVVLYLSVFSPGNNLEFAPYKYRTVYYSAYLDIPYRNKFAAVVDGRCELEQKLIKNTSKYAKRLKKIPFDLMTRDKNNIVSKLEEQKWISGWMKLNEKASEVHYLDKMFKLAQENNLNVLVIHCPYMKRAKEQMPEYSILFKASNEICGKYKNVKVYNAYDDDRYEEDDFLDLIHLSRSGATKMTQVIKEHLNLLLR